VARGSPCRLDAPWWLRAAVGHAPENEVYRIEGGRYTSLWGADLAAAVHEGPDLVLAVGAGAWTPLASTRLGEGCGLAAALSPRTSNVAVWHWPSVLRLAEAIKGQQPSACRVGKR
jgi:hypothetical protein